VFRQGRATGGVLLLRLGGMPWPSRAKLIVKVAEEHGAELMGAFSVMTAEALRIRTFD